MNEASDDHLINLQIANFQSISKAQKNLLIVLMSYLGFVWIYAFSPASDASIKILGLSLPTPDFWPITPAMLTVLTLGFIGTINAIGPVWAKLQSTATKAGLDFYDFDVQKNLLDYFTFLTLHPEKPLEDRKSRRFQLRHFLYPLVILASLYATSYSMRKLPSTCFYKTYSWGCIFVQVAFSIRIFWRALCRFSGIRQEH